jgi:L-2,4-diaminobutyrate decarboxylase
MSMKQFFDDFKDDFLLPSEENFSELLKRTDYLHEKILSQTHKGVPRIPLEEKFSYDEINYPAPTRSKDSKVVLSKLAQAFKGSVRWNQPTSLVNITPNPLLDSVAAANVVSAYNINCLWDYMSGGMTRLEKEVVGFLCHIAGWNAKTAEGLSTFGGKATLMYAIRCGLNVCDRLSVKNGLKSDYVVLTGKGSHYSIEDCANYMGIGKNNVVRVDTDMSGAMLPDAFEEAMRMCLKQKKKIAAIILSGGDTLHYAVDPIEAIHNIRNKLVREFDLPYKPYMHLDSVLGWVGMVFCSYDFKQNVLGIEPGPLSKIKVLYSKLAAVKYVNSFSADFHKTGLSPYTSSYFVVKDAADIYSINKDSVKTKPHHMYGDFHTHHYSLENSRPANGIVSAWTSMQRLGLDGYQRYWAQLMTTGLHIRDIINTCHADKLRVLNTSSLGYPSVIQLIPKGLNIPYEELPNHSKELRKFNEYCFRFYDYMAYGLLQTNLPYPLLGFIPNYNNFISGGECPAFLIYANHPHLSSKDCKKLIDNIVIMKRDFDKKWETNKAVGIPTAFPTRLPR